MKFKKFTLGILCLYVFTLVNAQQLIEGTLSHDGIGREYTAFLPSSYQNGDELPENTFKKK